MFYGLSPVSGFGTGVVNVRRDRVITVIVHTVWDRQKTEPLHIPPCKDFFGSRNS